MTDNRVPRWVSEGLSVFEEHRARPGWGDDVSIPFLVAYQKGQLLPIKDLNNGFIRPSYPHQITNSYYQASLVFELIERDYGFPAILTMLTGYKEGLTTPEVFRSALGVGLDAFDETFQHYLAERFAAVASVIKPPPDDQDMEALSPEQIQNRLATDPRDFLGQLAMGEVLFKKHELDEAQEYLTRAKALFPDHGDPNSPSWYLAQIYRERGELESAEKELAAYTAINESHYEAHLALAEVRESRGNLPGAAEALARAAFIYPLELQPHRRLAEIYRELGDFQSAIPERQAVVALELVDRAQAIYELAMAYYQAGDATNAKRQVLRALEIAPNFGEAQDLLLSLQPATGREGAARRLMQVDRGGE
jgi:tetratricopeptide (TPR) repeat protein